VTTVAPKPATQEQSSGPLSPAPATNLVAPGGIDTATRNVILQQHNECRKMHQSPSLILDQELCQSAQRVAEACCRKQQLEHSDTPNGENLYFSGQKGTSFAAQNEAKAAVKSWYDEISRYDFSGTSNPSGSNHFTQVVWRESRKLGVGVASATNSDGMLCTYVVCQYQPAGNFLGEYKANVLPRQ